MQIRQLQVNEYDKALTLSLDVFIQCGKNDFDEEGLKTFKSFIYNKDLVNELTIYGAFEGESLIGLIATKNEGKHISLFFITPMYHGKGIGKRLFEAAIQDKPVSEMTVNSSSYAIPIYRKFGFEPICEEQTTHGMKYTPMKRTITRPSFEDFNELLLLWEASVRSTHHFLKEEDILFYKELVPGYFPLVELYIIRNERGKIAAFMGLSDELIEMLFVHPEEQGKGLGKRLIQYALQETPIRKVDVNEQNTTALHFYQHLGFQVIGRDETDSSNKPFPILHLQATLP